MVLSDVNGNGKKSAAERWLRQRNGQRASAARCIFGPPEKRAQLMVLMRNEAEMDRKRAEFAARYELVGLSANERRNFYDGLVKTSSSSSSSPPISHNNRQQQHYCGGHPQNNNDHARNTKSASDHHHYHHNQQQQQHHNSYYHHQQQKNNSFNQPDDERN